MIQKDHMNLPIPKPLTLKEQEVWWRVNLHIGDRKRSVLIAVFQQIHEER